MARTIAAAVALCLVLTAGAATARGAPSGSPKVRPAASVTGDFQPRYRGSWNFFNGSRAERAAVRRVISRMNFPYKRFLGRFVVFRFGGASSHAGYALPQSGYVRISLYEGWTPFVLAHELGHAADAVLLGMSDQRTFNRMVARAAPRGDCLSRHTRWHRRFARLHSCQKGEEWASAFAHAYWTGATRAGPEGTRLSESRVRGFAKRHLWPQDNGVTRLFRVSCYFPDRNVLARVTVSLCRDGGGMANPQMVNCTYWSSPQSRVTRRLEQSECRNRIAAAAQF